LGYEEGLQGRPRTRTDKASSHPHPRGKMGMLIYELADLIYFSATPASCCTPISPCPITHINYKEMNQGPRFHTHK